MEDVQKVKNRLGTIYISLMILIAVIGFINGLIVMDLINIGLVLLLFVMLQTKMVKVKVQCLLSIIVGCEIFFTTKGISIIFGAWLAIYSLIALAKVKNE